MPTMLDAIYATRIPASGWDAAAGYLGGHWADYPAVIQRFPGRPVMSIAVFADIDADCLDVETGDATIAQAPGWFQRQKARGSRYIVFYTSVSNANSLVDTLAAAGIPRSAYFLWTAHYGVGEHCCSPTCYPGNQQTADGTQWTDAAPGPCDQSVISAAFLAAITGPVDPPAPPPQPVVVKPPYPLPGMEDLMVVEFSCTTGTDGTAYVGVDIPAGCTHIVAGSVDVLSPYAFDPPRHDVDVTAANPDGVVCAPAVGSGAPPGQQFLRITGGAPVHFYTGRAIFA